MYKKLLSHLRNFLRGPSTSYINSPRTRTSLKVSTVLFDRFNYRIKCNNGQSWDNHKLSELQVAIMEVKNLEIVGMIAFDGTTRNALKLHPDENHLLYPISKIIIIKNLLNGKEDILVGHTDKITALAISPCGRFVASGQITYPGFTAMVIVYDYHKRTIKSSYEMHKVKIEDICFTCESNYLISLGGKDDGNVVVWDVQNNEAICGARASNEISGDVWIVTRMNLRDQCFLTGGDRTLKVWTFDQESRHLTSVDVKFGKLRRLINCISVEKEDDQVYCGTTSGDILRVRLTETPVMIGCYSKLPTKNTNNKPHNKESLFYSAGVKNFLSLGNSRFIVGTGNGTLELIEILDAIPFKKLKKHFNCPLIKTHLSINLNNSSITSIIRYKDDSLLIGTLMCEIYQVLLSNFNQRLLETCHTKGINSLMFPHNYSQVFATGGKNDLRLWQLENRKELLRITVKSFVCSSLCFSYDGRLIITAWNDGTIKAFAPKTGKLCFTIHNAHVKAVSSLAITSDDKTLMSGGYDGQIHLWKLKLQTNMTQLRTVLKEHRGSITYLSISLNDTEAISSSMDGTCVIWDIMNCVRKYNLIGNTTFTTARYTPDNIQILTCGMDGKIEYWESLDGSLVRQIQMEGHTGAINCLDISKGGRHFVTGSNDAIVRLWNYERGEVTHIGSGHGSKITGCRFDPDNKFILTVADDGTIVVWKNPVFRS